MSGAVMKLTPEVYREVRARLAALGHVGDWEWSQNLRPPATAEALVCEYTWVVLNSGMKNTIARKIMDRVWPCLLADLPLHPGVFGHRAKALALGLTWSRRARLFEEFRAFGLTGLAPCDGDHLTATVVAWCEALPWIGQITKYHLAKNLGVDCAKPDRWLVRLADAEGETVDGLCARLAREVGDRIATVDVVLWRACAVGVLVTDGKTIEINQGATCQQ